MKCMTFFNQFDWLQDDQNMSPYLHNYIIPFIARLLEAKFSTDINKQTRILCHGEYELNLF